MIFLYFTSEHPWICGCLAGILFSALTTLLAVIGFFLPYADGYYYLPAVVAVLVSFLLLAKDRPTALLRSAACMVTVVCALEIALVQLGTYPFYYGIAHPTAPAMPTAYSAGVLTLKLHAFIGLAFGLLLSVATLIILRVRVARRKFSVRR